MVAANVQRQRVPSFECTPVRFLLHYNLYHDKHELSDNLNNVSPGNERIFFIRIRIVIELALIFISSV